MLGDLLASARQSSGRFQKWLAMAEPELAARVDAAAARVSVTPTTYVRMAMADFARLAREEDWATLTSNLKRTDDPGTACLLAMVDWRLTAKACSQHSHDGSRLQGAHDGETHFR